MSEALIVILRAYIGAPLELSDGWDFFLKCREFLFDLGGLFLGGLVFELKENDVAVGRSFFELLFFTVVISESEEGDECEKAEEWFYHKKWCSRCDQIFWRKLQIILLTLERWLQKERRKGNQGADEDGRESLKGPLVAIPAPEQEEQKDGEDRAVDHSRGTDGIVISEHPLLVDREIEKDDE